MVQISGQKFGSVHSSKRPGSSAHSGFTLTELLIVILIIGLLVGILIPVVTSVQKSAKAAASQAIITQLTTAMESYFGDFHAYPGPLPDFQVYTSLRSGEVAPVINDLVAGGALANSDHITGSENMTLGLVGGLRLSTAGTVDYDRRALDSARGPGSLNAAQPKLYKSYLATANLYKPLTAFTDESGAALDSPIPEFVDTFSSPMPILYLRAARGKPVLAGAASAVSNNVITKAAAAGAFLAPYDVSQIAGYVGTGAGNTGTGSTTIGVGKDLPEFYQGGVAKPKRSLVPYHGLRDPNPVTPAPQTVNTGGTNYNLPMDSYAYFCDPTVAAQPVTNHRARKNDSYILISAGKDRVYGTDDDITNFGNVAP